MPKLQYQSKPTVPLIPSTVPVGIDGMAWFVPFNEPQFTTTTKPYIHQTQTNRVDPPVALAGIAGMAWQVAFSEPRFRGVPSEQQQTSMWTPSPDTLPPTIAGMAWQVAFNEPRFTTTYKVHQHQTEAYIGNTNIFPPPISGMAWHRIWSEPRFRGFPSEQQQTKMFVATSTTLPPIVVGMWHRPWNEPYFAVKTKVHLNPTQPAAVLIPSTLPVGVSGMAWWRPFDQPKQRKVDVFEQSFVFQNLTTVYLQAPYSSVYIIF